MTTFQCPNCVNFHTIASICYFVFYFSFRNNILYFYTFLHYIYFYIFIQFISSINGWFVYHWFSFWGLALFWAREWNTAKFDSKIFFSVFALDRYPFSTGFFNLYFTLKYLFTYLLNFNYIDLKIQIVDKLTIKINKKKKKSQDLNNWVSLYRIRGFFIKINFLN